MPSIDIAINSFQGGELNPLLFGRTESQFFRRSCQKLENMFIHVEGAAEKRGGTRYIAPANDETQPVRLIEFEFSREDAFMLEFGHEYIRVLARDGIVQDHEGNDVVVTTIYQGDQLEQLQFVQSADVLFLAHPDHPPQQFVRDLDEDGNVVWTFEVYVYDDGPYLDENQNDDFMLNPTAATGASVTVNATGTGHAPFLATDVGRFLRIFSNDKWGYGEILVFISTTSVSIRIEEDFGDATASERFQLGAWSETLGYPSAVTIYERRLIWAATRSNPQTFWATVTDDFYTFTPTETDGTVASDSGLSLTLGGSRVSLIRWLVGAQNLVIGTSGGLYRTETTSGSPLSADTARVLYDNGVECADVQPVQIGTNVIFLQKQRKKFFSVRYDFGIDGLSDNNISQYSEHLLRPQVREYAIQKEPNALLWGVLEDGNLVCCTYEPSQNVVAWGLHTIGGTFRGGNARVESLRTVAGDGEDNTWMVVRRTIDGAERRYIERIVEDNNTEQQFAWHLDCAAMEDQMRTVTDLTADMTTITITTSEDHGFDVGDRLCFYNFVGSSELNLKRAFITAVPTTTTLQFEFTDELGVYIEGGEIRRFFDTVTGLDHLEDQTLTVLADGAAQPDVVVSGGSVTLSSPAAILIIGFRFSAILSPRPFVADGSGFGSQSQNRKKRNVKTFVRLHRTLGLKFGTSLENFNEFEKLDILPFRTTSDRMDTAIPLLSGEVEFTVPSNYAFNEQFFLVNDQPFPFVILAIYAQIDVTR